MRTVRSLVLATAWAVSARRRGSRATHGRRRPARRSPGGLVPRVAFAAALLLPSAGRADVRLGHCEPEPLAVARVSPGASVASRGEGAVVAFGLDLEAGVTAFHGVRDERGGCHDLAIQPTLGYALRLGGLESHQAALGLSFGPSFPPVAFLASAKLLAGALDGDFAVGVRVGARVSTFLDMLGLELSYQWDRTEVGDWHAFEARLVLDAGTLLSILLR